MGFPVDQQFIAEAELALGRELPPALTSRLRRNNGGEVRTEDMDWTLYPVYDSGDRKRISRTANHIIRELLRWRTWHGFPEGAVAIAEDGCGNALIVLAGSDEIREWNHETGEHAAVVVEWG
jgi:SMI1 / KNR4 family (SUKH-1)